MRTSCFDAAVSFPPRGKEEILEALLLFKIKKTKVSGSFFFYPRSQRAERSGYFVRIHTSRPLSLKWKDRFEVKQGKSLLGEGKVLNPRSEKAKGKKARRRIAFLRKLLGGEEEMLAAVVEEKGSQGIKEEELIQFSSLSPARLLSLSQELEEKGVLKILSFSPLFILSKKSFDFLCQKILRYLSAFHQRQPKERGVPWEKLMKRFSVDRKVLSLAIHRLSRENKVGCSPERVFLWGFEQTLSARDEQLLKNFEEMGIRGEFQTASLQELSKSLGISFQKMDRLVSILVERKKVVLGKDGFIVHSPWLDELISQVRKCGKRELSVSDFKKMTGLSRKYVIPLLELLDQLGVTRRRGPTREIL